MSRPMSKLMTPSISRLGPPTAGPAREADRRQAGALADRAPACDHGRGRRRGLSLARRPRPPTRPHVRPSARGDVTLAMGQTPLSPDETTLGPPGWSGDTPLWLYVLSEAKHRGNGKRLGPVGRRIVAEVLIGIIDADPAAYRSRHPTGPLRCPRGGKLRALGHADPARQGVAKQECRTGTPGGFDPRPS
jgi:hypothetical protein